MAGLLDPKSQEIRPIYFCVIFVVHLGCVGFFIRDKAGFIHLQISFWVKKDMS